jgi:serine/threonine protein kinase
VATVHAQRIVHSDLKPANFLLVEGQLKLIDFGIAKAIQADTTSIARESQVGGCGECMEEWMNEWMEGRMKRCKGECVYVLSNR